jgi:hypothetical protein
MTMTVTPNATACYWARMTNNGEAQWSNPVPPNSNIVSAIVPPSPWADMGRGWVPGTYTYYFRCESSPGVDTVSGPHVLTVTAPTPAVSITPVGTSFVGQMIVGNTLAVPNAFIISNTGDPGSTLRIDSITVTGSHPSDFVITGCATPMNLPASASITCGVNFTPSAVGPRAASVNISGNVTANYAITGTGIIPITASWDMGRVVVNRPRIKPFDLQNQGPIAIPNVVIGTAGAGGEFECSAAQAGPFAATCTIGDLNGFQTKQVWIRFSPTTPGVKSINATVSATGYANLPTIPIRGTGVAGNFQFCEPGDAGCR